MCWIVTLIVCEPAQPQHNLSPQIFQFAREGTGWRDTSPLQRQALIPTYCQQHEPRLEYLSHAVFHHRHFCCFLSSDVGLFLSHLIRGWLGLNSQLNTEISLYNLKIILIGKTNIYFFGLWCSDLYCGKSSDPPIVIVLNISSLRGIKQWYIRVVHQLTRSNSGIPWDIRCLH